MIVPQIQISQIQLNAGADLDSLVDQIKHWSLFGSLALTAAKSSQVPMLETALKSVGGLVDLMIGLDSYNEKDALTLLNAGASHILCDNADTDLGLVPDDRVRMVAKDASPDEAIPAGYLLSTNDASVDRVAELEMARFDCLVDVESLTADWITQFFKTVLVTDREDGLWSTVIVDPLGIALGLAYSNEESLHHAIENRVGTYWSRSRDGLWIKGETSGATQHLLNIRMDCDRDCLRFMVTQEAPGFCHRNTNSCFGEERTIQTVIQRLVDRMKDSDEKSFTRKLANDPAMLETKLLEEAKELSEASQADDQSEVAWEAADVLYFSLVAMLKNGVSLDQVYHELARRMNRVVRRKNKLEE
jgi:phosphoribosyl-ATP pyrophosphohydrolase/phosphoribosyl-AMP cyclohydrolase/histidinol dehydrogenase